MTIQSWCHAYGPIRSIHRNGLSKVTAFSNCIPGCRSFDDAKITILES